MSAADVPDCAPAPVDPVHRMGLLVDDRSLRLMPGPVDAGAVSATGRIDGRPVGLFACDPRRGGGALGEAGSQVIVGTIEAAVRRHVPVVGIWHSGGARLQDGTASLHGIGRVFRTIVEASGRIPQVSVVLGPAAGGAAYGPALTDFVISGPASRIFVTGPEIVRRVTGEAVDAAVLGGPEQHATTSGLTHVAEPSDAAALGVARALVGLLSVRQVAATSPVCSDLRFRAVLPTSPRRAYDIHRIVDLLLDEESPRVELQRRWGRNVVTVVGRIGGRTVGVLANNPLHLAGCLDSTGSEKAARFVRTCDALGLPLAVLADVPGYLPGRRQEAEGIVRRGAKLLHAFAESVVPRVTVIVRKAYGGAFVAMNSRALGATAVFAWPAAEVGVMHPRSAVAILHRRLLGALPTERHAAALEELAAAYERGAGGLSGAVARKHVDQVIDPADTKRFVTEALASAVGLRGVHSNIPL
jgi:acetyl-CoA/propionyl-CoA carboxylase carboxyl transferase subunit